MTGYTMVGLIGLGVIVVVSMFIAFTFGVWYAAVFF